MARTNLPVTTLKLTGVSGAVATNADATNGMYFQNSSNKTWLHIKNTSGSPVTVTVGTVFQPPAGLTVNPLTITVPATTGDIEAGPFDSTSFNQPGGIVNLDFSSATGVTIAAFQLS